MAVAVTDKHAAVGCCNALQALTAAALLLPGVQVTLAQSAPALSVQASRFEEGQRHTSVDTGLTPLQAWTLDLRAAHPLNDSINLDIGFTQDTWSGATPVTTAPATFNGNRPRRLNVGSSTVISGASPLLNGSLQLDRELTPLTRTSTGSLQTNDGNELIMSSASPELRQQLATTLTHVSSDRRLQLDTSYSHEDDYLSRHIASRAEFDFNNKLTTLAVGAGYTNSRISADLSGEWLPYVTTTLQQHHVRRRGNAVLLEGHSSERSIDVGLTQILNRSALLDIGVSVRNAGGLLENPYRAMTTIFVDPAALASTASTVAGDVRALLEQRPDQRRIQALSAHYVQHVAPFNAALHVNYDYSHDDWDIDSHAIELQWLQPLGDYVLAPRLRWYSQSSAWFHQSHLVSKQRYRGLSRDEQGREIWLNANDNQRYVRTNDGRYLDANGVERDPALLDLQPSFTLFSPALLPTQYSSDPRLGSYGVLSAGLTLQRRFDNGLLLEAGIDHYRRASALQFNGAGDTPYADFNYTAASVALTLDLQTVARRQRQSPHAHNHDMTTPPGLLLSHNAGSAGSWSSGYRLQQMDSMTMHMLDVAWHPHAQWTLMLMPQFMTMEADHVHSDQAGNAGQSSFADTIVAALWHHPTVKGEWQLTAGLGVPASGYGSADLLPSLQYRTRFNRWQLGARVDASQHLAAQHAADMDPLRSLTTSVWAGTPLTSRLTATLRTSHTEAHYTFTGTSTDTTVGASLAFNMGAPMLSIEWLVPLASSGNPPPNGRGHSLVASWHLAL
ncbi:MAG: DUF3570 domain-containing protein [Pseudomonadota bacterium]